MSNFFRLKNGRIVVAAEAPGGIYNSTQLKKIADLCAQDLAIVKTTEDQRISLFVKEEDLDAVQLVLDAAGLSLRHYQDGIHQAVACIGEMCAHSEQDAVASAVAITEACAGKQCDKPLKIGINGCSKCCVPSHSLDIDILGESGGYRLSLGGKNAHIPELAAFMAEHIPAGELADLVGKVIDLYNEKKQEDETLHDVLDRCGTSDFADILAPYSQDAACFDSLDFEAQLPDDSNDTQKPTEEVDMAEPVDDDLDFDFSESLNEDVPDVGEISPSEHLQASSTDDSRIDLEDDLSPSSMHDSESLDVTAADVSQEADEESEKASGQAELNDSEDSYDEKIEAVNEDSVASEDSESLAALNLENRENEIDSEVVMSHVSDTESDENIELSEDIDKLEDDLVDNEEAVDVEADGELDAIEQDGDNEEMSEIEDTEALELDDDSEQEHFEAELNESIDREVEINESSADYVSNDTEREKAVSAVSDSAPDDDVPEIGQSSASSVGYKNKPSNVASMFRVSGFGFNPNGDFHLSFVSGAFIDIDVSSLDNGEQREISLGNQSFAVTKGVDGLTVEVDGLKFFCPFESMQSAS